MVYIVLNLFELSNPPVSIRFQSILKRCMKCIDSDYNSQNLYYLKAIYRYSFLCVLNLHEFIETVKVGVNTFFLKQ